MNWFLLARQADRSLREKNSFLTSSSGNEWFDEEARAFVNLLAKKNEKDTTIRGYSALVPHKQYHSPKRTAELVDEVYDHLLNGRIVILDLSVGPSTIREEMSLRIAEGIFDKSMQTFISGKFPSHIIVYVEEAHNLIGRKHELTAPWPRLAKEGAKYRIGLVYATQEPSSVHPNILANTENWFVTHLNNEGELREISKFYDFADFSQSLLRAQDVGFARVKTLSGPFVIPIQIDLFDPKKEIERQMKLGKYPKQ
jgi:DNA helicase HerA-like ATPase